jgi:hypothetical protein
VLYGSAAVVIPSALMGKWQGYSISDCSGGIGGGTFMDMACPQIACAALACW